MSASSRRLLDHWAPPDGAGRALGCVATTFTLEPDFFESQCLGRFLRLDTRPGEGSELAALVEREEALAETHVVVLADRGCNPEGRSLRWDVVPVTAPTGVMHAKVALLVWEHRVRVLVASANLTERSYRGTIELAVALDVMPGCELPRTVVAELLERVRRIAELGPGSGSEPGPRSRALELVGRAVAHVDGCALPERAPRGAPQIAIVGTGLPGDADALAQLEALIGRPPTRATVMSPYFDVGAGASRAARRLVELLARRGARAEVVVPLEQLDGHAVARVPAALQEAFPPRIPLRLCDVRQPDANEPRALHGKLVLLEHARSSCALVGSANFSAPGLGIGGGGNVEVGIAVLARTSTPAAEALAELPLAGEPISPQVEQQAAEDPEEQTPPLPAGFVQALVDPRRQLLRVELDAARLPETWSIATPDGELVAEADRWREDGASRWLERPLDALVFVVEVRWRDGEATHRVALPVNVTDPAGLPPPEELRALPIAALLHALASTRPLHEAVAAAAERAERTAHGDVPLDALDRFAPSGQLLHRTRALSAALTGLRDRIERPAASLDAVRWRIEGPFGPVAIAEKLVAERRNAARSLPGETSFLLGEIALTLAGVDLGRTTRLCPEHRRAAELLLGEAIEGLAALCDADGDPALRSYIDDAFARARA